MTGRRGTAATVATILAATLAVTACGADKPTGARRTDRAARGRLVVDLRLGGGRG